MPLFSSQSNNADSESRYGDLLHPCSDINKNWAINVAETLKQYLDELASINVEIRNGEFTLNFAEAALLIQGSTSIFSKKVEYLYNLANQLLLQLHNEKKETSGNSGAAKMKDSILLGRTASEFVALDDMTRCNNLNMNDDGNNKKMGIPKVPMAPMDLIPLDSSEKGNVVLFSAKGEEIGKKKDYQMNFCTIHNSGCLLLPTTYYEFSSEPYSSQVVSDICEMEADESETEDLCSPDFFTSEHEDLADDLNNDVVPDSHTSESSQNSEQLPNLDLTPLHSSAEVDHVVENDAVPRRRSMRQALKVQKAIEEKQRKEEMSNKSAWDVSEEKRPELKKQIQKKNIRKLPRKLIKKPSVRDQAEEDECENKNDNSTLNFCSKNFFGVENKFLKKGTFAVNKLYINEAFQQLVVEHYKKQQEILQSCRKKLKLEDDVAVKEEEEKEEALHTDEDSFGDDDLGADPLPDDDDNEEDNIPSASENGDLNPIDDLNCESPVQCSSVEDSPCTYEELVRKHVENYMKDVAQFCQTTELSEKVNQWEEKIKPILDNENERESFNIHVYGTRIIDQFENNNRKQTIAFKDVCRGKKRWEVCRYFLASLQLANNRNVEITSFKKQDGMHNIKLTLLSRKRHQEQLDEFGHTQGEH